MAELFWAQSESCGFKNMPTVFLSSAPRLLKISPAVARGTRQSQNLLPDLLIPPKEGETLGVAVLVTPGIILPLAQFDFQSEVNPPPPIYPPEQKLGQRI